VPPARGHRNDFAPRLQESTSPRSRPRSHIATASWATRIPRRLLKNGYASGSSWASDSERPTRSVICLTDKEARQRRQLPCNPSPYEIAGSGLTVQNLKAGAGQKCRLTLWCSPVAPHARKTSSYHFFRQRGRSQNRRGRSRASAAVWRRWETRRQSNPSQPIQLTTPSAKEIPPDRWNWNGSPRRRPSNPNRPTDANAEQRSQETARSVRAEL